MGSCICCGYDCLRQDGAFGLYSSDILVTYERGTRLEPYVDIWCSERWGDSFDLRISDSWLGCRSLWRAADPICKYGRPRRRYNITGMGNDTSLFLPGVRHWESRISRSGSDRVWGRGIKMVHQKARTSHRTGVSGWSSRQYHGDSDRIIGHIQLEHQCRLGCFGNHGSCGVCLARNFADRGTT